MIIIDNNLLDSLFEQAKESPRQRIHLDLRDSETDGSQRMLNVLLKTTRIPIHRHPDSSESIFLLRGKIDEVFFDDEGNETERFHLDPLKGNYGIQVPAGKYHTLEVLEPAVIFESKNGKYEAPKKEDLLLC
jgi:hypothetical protein